MRVAELMQTDVKSVPADAPVADVVRVMADAHVSGLPVISASGKVLGVVTATDVLEAEAEREDARSRARLFENTTASDLMNPQPLVIEPDADVRQAAQEMLYAEVSRLFVVERDRLVGVISQTDIAQAVGTGRI